MRSHGHRQNFDLSKRQMRFFPLLPGDKSCFLAELAEMQWPKKEHVDLCVCHVWGGNLVKGEPWERAGSLRLAVAAGPVRPLPAVKTGWW